MSREADRQELPVPLRRDVRLLGGLLGEVIRESGGQGLLDDVERLRRAVIAARENPPGDEADPAGDEIAALVAGWPLDRAELVAKAFTIYFHLTNLAEERHRVRVLHGQADLAQEKGDGGLRRESLAAAVAEFGTAPARLAGLLAGLRVEPVLTAHPTEARRRAVAAALRRMAVLIQALDQAPAPAEAAEVRRRLREEIGLLWLTSPLRVKPIGPVDEVRTVMAVFDDTLFGVAPAFYRALDQACRAMPGTGTGPAPVATACLRFGSWVGADRDGNPTVTAQVTRDAAVIHADHALRALENATTRIGRALTIHAASAPPSAGLALALEAAETEHPELLARIGARSPEEPYRTFLLFLAERVRATRLRQADLAYAGCDAFLADLRLVQDSLTGAGAGRQAFGELQNLIWQAETFGFHAASLEVRQHSAVHERALGEAEAGGEVSAQSAEVLATMRAIGWIQGRFGVAACHRYVVSF